MKNLVKAAGLAGVISLSLLARTQVVQAAESGHGIEEGEGLVTALGDNTSAVTYWVSQPDGWHVVTTINTKTQDEADGGHSGIVRFSTLLAPGQSQSISVPAENGATQPTLLIRRVSDRIEVETSPALY
jgi:hypothetical protein